ncbi:G-protein-signaling modulator 3 [Monodelphis domestica]|uniref:G-protein-signaling modulator 3 n=1 Tax=Monodelphis domestica TaxID=13616 RepID=F7BYC4_MONDO|nr:G-protein-signaling modulator 3 [Monodelphis domestica]
METKRLQEEEDEIEQCLPQDDQGWPPLNTIRPWRSAPPTPPHSRDNTALGPRSASMLSLQTELFLDLVAEAQSKRLEGQRATFHTPPGSLTTASASVQVTEDRDQLYSTILSHQCQRIEAQRSDPPLPPGGQELLELLLRVQGGGRMEEQRSRPPAHTC